MYNQQRNSAILKVFKNIDLVAQSMQCIKLSNSLSVFHVRKIVVPDSRSGSPPDLDLPTKLAKFVFISF
jgi:hypothetical protein